MTIFAVREESAGGGAHARGPEAGGAGWESLTAHAPPCIRSRLSLYSGKVADCPTSENGAKLFMLTLPEYLLTIVIFCHIDELPLSRYLFLESGAYHYGHAYVPICIYTH